MGAGDEGRTHVKAGDLADRLDHDREFELCVLLDSMPRDARKARLDEYPVRLRRQFQAHALIDDTTIAHEQHERLADIFSRGHGVEQEADLTRIRLLGEVEPEYGVVQRERGVFEKRALRCRRDAPLGSAQVAFGKTGPTQQGPRVRPALS